MTVSSSTSRVSYAGNGVTTVFAVPFYFLSNSQLSVSLWSSAGVESVQTLGTDYSVSGAGVLTGGTLTMTIPPASGTNLIITRAVPLTQETDLQPNDRLPAETLEQSIDKLTMITQQNAENANRAIRSPLADPVAIDMRLPVSTVRRRKVLGFTDTGAPYMINSVDDLENIIQNGNPLSTFPADLGSIADPIIIYRYDLGGL
jgi:hypothetical protein